MKKASRAILRRQQFVCARQLTTAVSRLANMGEITPREVEISLSLTKLTAELLSLTRFPNELPSGQLSLFPELEK